MYDNSSKSKIGRHGQSNMAWWDIQITHGTPEPIFRHLDAYILNILEHWKLDLLRHDQTTLVEPPSQLWHHTIITVKTIITACFLFVILYFSIYQINP